MKKILTALAALSLISALLVTGEVNKPGDQLWWALLLGLLATLTVNFTVAAARARN